MTVVNGGIVTWVGWWEGDEPRDVHFLRLCGCAVAAQAWGWVFWMRLVLVQSNLFRRILVWAIWGILVELVIKRMLGISVASKPKWQPHVLGFTLRASNSTFTPLAVRSSLRFPPATGRTPSRAHLIIANAETRYW